MLTELLFQDREPMNAYNVIRYMYTESRRRYI
jgi:hypothetical protein